MTYAVTGSTGAYGTLAVHHLLSNKVPASSIVALARDAEKAAALKSLGVQVRVADYEDKTSLEKALQGVDRLLLVSGSTVGKRIPQHQNVVDAAKAAGIKLLVYSSIVQADTSLNPLAPEHKATEEYIRQSGIPFVFLRDNWYTENYVDDLRHAKTSGVIASAVGSGRIASASRTDYAAAAARVLIGEGHSNKVYELTGSYAWTFKELAKTAGEVLGREVQFQKLSPAERKTGLMSVGLPENVADFVTSLDLTAEAGTLSLVTGDLAKLLGHAPLSLKEGLKLLQV